MTDYFSKEQLTGSFNDSIDYKFQYYVSQSNQTIFDIDYSEFDSHVFLNNAYYKTNKAIKNIEDFCDNKFDEQEYYKWLLESSEYEKYFYRNEYPKYRGYYTRATQVYPTIKVVDNENILNINTASFSFDFWFAKNKDIADGRKAYIFNSDNGSGYPDLNKMQIYVTGSAGSDYMIYAVDSNGYNFPPGADPRFSGFASVNIDDNGTDWHHYAITQEDLDVKMYVDSKLLSTGTITDVYSSGEDFQYNFFYSASSEPVNIHIASGSTLTTFCDGRLKDFRFWHKVLPQNEINIIRKRHNFSQDNLMFNFTFNDPYYNEETSKYVVQTQDNNIYGLCVDYSSETYLSSSFLSGTVTGSLGEELLTSYTDFPIRFPTYYRVVDWKDELLTSASDYDRDNNQCIIRQVPTYLYQESIKSSDDYFNKFLFTIAEILDEYKISVDQFGNLINYSYQDDNNVPDALLQQFVNSNYNLSNNTFIINKELSSFYDGEGESNLYNVSLNNVKNDFYRKLLLHLSSILKEKGTANFINDISKIAGFNQNNFRVKNFYMKDEYNTLSDYDLYQTYEYDYCCEFTGSNIGSMHFNSSAPYSYIDCGTGTFATLVFPRPVSDFSIETRVKFRDYLKEEFGENRQELVLKAPNITSGSIYVAEFCDPTDSPNFNQNDNLQLFFGRDLSGSTGQLVIDLKNYNGTTTYNTHYFNTLSIFDNEWRNIIVSKNNRDLEFAVTELDNAVYTIVEQETVSDFFPDFTTGSTRDKYRALKGIDFGDPTLEENTVMVKGNTEFEMQEFRFWAGEYLTEDDYKYHTIDYKNYGKNNFDVGKLGLHYKFDDNIACDSTGEINYISNSVGWNSDVLPSTAINTYGGIRFYNAIEDDNPFNSYKMVRNIMTGELALRYSNMDTKNIYIEGLDYPRDLNKRFAEMNLYDEISEHILKNYTQKEKFNDLVNCKFDRFRREYKTLKEHNSKYFMKYGFFNDYFNINNYINFMTWIDNNFVKILKQLFLNDDTNVNVIVVEDHILNRNKYEHKYIGTNISAPAFKKDFSTYSNYIRQDLNKYDPVNKRRIDINLQNATGTKKDSDEKNIDGTIEK